MKKRFFFAAMMLLATTGAFAQGNGIGGITEATNMVTSYFDPGTKLIYNNPTSQKFCCVDVAVGCSPQSNPHTLNSSACLIPSALG